MATTGALEVRPLSEFGAEQIAFLPKCTYPTYGQTDICKYRVASLLKRKLYGYT